MQSRADLNMGHSKVSQITRLSRNYSVQWWRTIHSIIRGTVVFMQLRACSVICEITVKINSSGVVFGTLADTVCARPQAIGVTGIRSRCVRHPAAGGIIACCAAYLRRPMIECRSL